MEVRLSNERILLKDKIYLSKDNKTKILNIYYPNLNNSGIRPTTLHSAVEKLSIKNLQTKFNNN